MKLFTMFFEGGSSCKTLAGIQVIIGVILMHGIFCPVLNCAFGGFIHTFRSL